MYSLGTKKRIFQSLETKNETHVQFRDENNTVWSVEDDGKLLGSLGAQGQQADLVLRTNRNKPNDKNI